VFTILNKLPRLRNYPPFVCKFLDSMTVFFHARETVAWCCSYLLEQIDFKNHFVAAIGLPIAIPLPAAYIRKGKD
jgi:hypothetical protein